MRMLYSYNYFVKYFLTWPIEWDSTAQHELQYVFHIMRFSSLCDCCIEGLPTRFEQTWAYIWACESAYVMVDGLFAPQVIECYRIDGLLQQLLDINHPSISIIIQPIFILYFLKRILFNNARWLAYVRCLRLKIWTKEYTFTHTHTRTRERDAVWCDDYDYAQKALT